VRAALRYRRGPMRRKKGGLPTKICPVCLREFEWRKRWRNNWDRVVYCSERCQRRRNDRQGSARRSG
jgi:hypothetical protein